jgi:hypothetical protein
LNYNGGIKMKIDTIFITLAIVAAGTGAYVLLTGDWATPITEWLIMG